MCLLMLFSLAKVKQVSKKSLECFLFEESLLSFCNMNQPGLPIFRNILYGK